MATVTDRGHSAKAKTPTEAPKTPDPRRRSLPWALELYRSALGKKYVMAITGIVLMGYVLAHMIGNLKLYLGAEAINFYGEWLRDGLGYPALPHDTALWILRTMLIASFVLHIHAAYALTVMNRKARPTAYRSSRDYVAAGFASRTMRWTGVIILLFVLYHLADLTWGWANPDFLKGDVYGNMIASFNQVGVAVLYLVANLALGIHLYHGGWSLFQTMGWNNRRFNEWRRAFAIGFAVIVTAGNLSFPIAVQLDLVEDERAERFVLPGDVDPVTGDVEPAND